MKTDGVKGILKIAHNLKFVALYLSAIVWLPFTKAVADTVITSPQTPFMTAIFIYKSEALIAASFVMLILGSLLSLRYQPPIDVPAATRMDKVTTFLFALTGGIAAFIYVLEQKQSLIILHPLWVLGVSIVTPSFIQVAFPIIIKIWYRFWKGKEGSADND